MSLKCYQRNTRCNLSQSTNLHWTTMQAGRTSENSMSFKLRYFFLTHCKSWPCKSLQMLGAAYAFSVVLKSVPDLAIQSSTWLTASSSCFWSPNLAIFRLSVLKVLNFKAFTTFWWIWDRWALVWKIARTVRLLEKPSKGLRHLLFSLACVSSETRNLQRVFAPPGGGEGVVPDIGYIGMSRAKGYVF